MIKAQAVVEALRSEATSRFVLIGGVSASDQLQGIITDCTQIDSGSLIQALPQDMCQDIINNLDVSDFKDKPIIIKGCSNKPVPQNAYIMLSNKLKPIAKSIMYGEACSSVPLFKKK